MALFRRGKWWWTDFSVNGVRYRISLDTRDWREALSGEREKIAEAQAGKLSVVGQSFARLAFTEAVDRYLADRLPRIQPKTAQIERERAVQLKKYFGTTPVSRISVDSVLAYIAERKQAETANAKINRYLDVLRGVLKRGKRWHTMAEDIRPLPMRHNVGRALSPDEELRLVKLAAAKPEWSNARLAAVLALNTTMRAGAIRGMRWQVVDFIERTITGATRLRRPAQRVFARRRRPLAFARRTSPILAIVAGRRKPDVDGVAPRRVVRTRGLRTDRRKRQVASDHWEA